MQYRSACTLFSFKPGYHYLQLYAFFQHLLNYFSGFLFKFISESSCCHYIVTCSENGGIIIWNIQDELKVRSEYLNIVLFIQACPNHVKILQQQSVAKKVKFEWFYHRKYEMKP